MLQIHQEHYDSPFLGKDGREGATSLGYYQHDKESQM